MNEYKSNDDKNRILSIEEYLNKIILYLKGIINNLKESYFISSNDDKDEERAMHSKSDIIEIMISDEANEVIKKHL